MYRFMYGRYGTDELYTFISVIVLVLLALEWILSFFLWKYTVGALILFLLVTFNIFLLVWSMVRCFSRKIEKRRRQNQKYLRARSSVKRFFSGNTSKKTKNGPMDGAGYIYRDCTRCSNTLRLPYKAGKNAVKCPKCGHRFFVKAKKL